jgi:tetratricopeptide (TPR) repeat protein
LVLAYGSIALTTSGVSVEGVKHFLIGIVTASALLHFYYDGFIWKVRETQTRAMLGIDGTGVGTLPAPQGWPQWVRHGLRWAVLVVPVAALCAAQLTGRAVPALERTAKVAEILPNDAQAQLNYAKALQDAGRVREAIDKYDLALGANPRLAEAEFLLGVAWSDLGELDEAIAHYERALTLSPNNAKAESNLAGLLVTKGLSKEARSHYEHSLSADPKLQIAHKELADLLCAAGEYDAAIAHYEAALRIQPDFVQAQENLSFARSLTGR